MFILSLISRSQGAAADPAIRGILSNAIGKQMQYTVRTVRCIQVDREKESLLVTK